MSKRSRRNRRRQDQQKQQRLAVVPPPPPEEEEVVSIETWFDIPAGRFQSWSTIDWEDFDNRLQTLTDAEQDEVWDIIEQREADGDYEDEEEKPPGDATIHGMTEAEWAEFAAALDSNEWDDPSSFTTWSEPTTQVVAGTPAPLPKPKDPDPLTDCTCQGPGSVTNKFKSHISSCKCFPGGPVKWPTKPVKPLCDHRKVPFDLEEGLQIHASSHRGYSSKKAEEGPDIGLGVYLDPIWFEKGQFLLTPGISVPWAPAAAFPKVLVPWPDRKAPGAELDTMLEALAWVLEELGKGVVIETGCWGGHGRTGTMLAGLLAMQGINPLDAINRVWETYCPQAIEDVSQCTFICEVYEAMHGTQWREDKKTRKAYSKMMHAYFTPKPVSYSGGYIPKGGSEKDKKPIGSVTPGIISTW